MCTQLSAIAEYALATRSASVSTVTSARTRPAVTAFRVKAAKAS